MVLVVSFLGSLFCFFDLVYFYFFFVLSVLVLLFFYSCVFWGVWAYTDSLSFFLLFLVFVIFFCCFLSSVSDSWGVGGFVSFFCFVVFIFFFLLVSFLSVSMLFFYVTFEFVFVLLFFFLLGWGYSPERLQASFYMIFYTLVVSFPFLVYLVLSGGGFGGKFLSLVFYDSFWWLSFVFVFLVKLPLYGVHLWLPKAHVEAPVSGSMVLAGVLLKLGGYGLLRVGFGLNYFFCVFKGYFWSWGLLGGLLGSFICIRQVDLKSFVAYSSVCHMSFGFVGLMIGYKLGVSGGVYMMVGHGFCSSCLFYLLFVFYERFSTRSMVILKGVIFYIPVVGGVWFVFSVLNMGVPPSLSFFSEVFILSSLISAWGGSLLISGFFLFFSGVYGIILFVFCSHGKVDGGGLFSVLSFRESLVFFVHFFYGFFSVLFLDYFF